MGKPITLAAALMIALVACTPGTDETTTSTAPSSSTTTTTPMVGVRDVTLEQLARTLCPDSVSEPQALYADLDEDGREEAVISALCPGAEVRTNGVFVEGSGETKLVGTVHGNDATIVGVTRPNLAVVLPIPAEGDGGVPGLVERVTYALEDAGLTLVDQRQLTTEEYLRSYAPDRPPQLTRIELLEELRTGVALIQSVACYPNSGHGTGFLVGPDLLITNAHVVEGATLLRVEVAGSAFPAELVGLDEVRDLALLRLPEPVRGHLFDLSTEQPRVGEPVTALGFPIDPRFSATGGEISGVGRRIVIGESFYENAIQTSAAINPGNSGGPLVDEDGNVVGVVSAGSFWADNVGFVIPAETVSRTTASWGEDPIALDLTPAGGCDTGTDLIDTNVVDLDLPPVLYSLDQYVAGINWGEPRRAWDVNAASIEGGDYEVFRDGVSTSYLFPFRIESLTRVSDTVIAVEVRFTSTQEPEYGRDGQTCTSWHQRYIMRAYDDGVWRIDDSTPITPPVSCDDEAP